MCHWIDALLSGRIAFLGQLDIDGFLLSQQFLSSLAQFISTLVLQILNLLLFGGLNTTGV
jgi:hypothetical protein